MVIHSIAISMLIGALLAIVILAIFLLDIRPTLVVAFSIPFSILTAIVIMYFTGISINLMSLFGISLAVGMLVDNSDEPYAREITRAVMNRRRKKLPIETTTQLKEVIEEALKFLPEREYKEAVKKSCQRTFQALRIDVNHEFEVLYTFLEKLPEVLAPGGRVAILTFHSGEDRLVKRSFKELQKAGIYSEVAADVIRPSAEECARNSRAKSTKMRWAIRAE